MDDNTMWFLILLGIAVGTVVISAFSSKDYIEIEREAVQQTHVPIPALTTLDPLLTLKDEPTGFRKFKLTMFISQFKKLCDDKCTELPQNYKNIIDFTIDDEDLSIGEAKIIKIQYTFFHEKLCTVGILFDKDDEATKAELLRIFSYKYGLPKKNEPPDQSIAYFWTWPNASISLINGMLSIQDQHLYDLLMKQMVKGPDGDGGVDKYNI
jgi:hypothetical protein